MPTLCAELLWLEVLTYWTVRQLLSFLRCPYKNGAKLRTFAKKKIISLEINFSTALAKAKRSLKLYS